VEGRGQPPAGRGRGGRPSLALLARDSAREGGEVASQPARLAVPNLLVVQRDPQLIPGQTLIRDLNPEEPINCCRWKSDLNLCEKDGRKNIDIRYSQVTDVIQSVKG